MFLLIFQTLGENAPSQLILYHYPDLKEEKGLVFLTAEMDPKFIVSGLHGPSMFPGKELRPS